MFDRLIASDPPPEHRWSAGAKLAVANVALNAVLLMLAPREAQLSPVKADTAFVICAFGHVFPSEQEASGALLTVPTAQGLAVEHVGRPPDAEEVYWSEAWLAVRVKGDSVYQLSANAGMDAGTDARATRVLPTLEAVVDSSGHAERSSIRILGGMNRSDFRLAMSDLKRIEFRLASDDRRPVRVLVRLPIDFVLTTAR